jgi:hypothetical protein
LGSGSTLPKIVSRVDHEDDVEGPVLAEERQRLARQERHAAGIADDRVRFGRIDRELELRRLVRGARARGKREQREAEQGQRRSGRAAPDGCPVPHALFPRDC